MLNGYLTRATTISKKNAGQEYTILKKKLYINNQQTEIFQLKHHIWLTYIICWFVVQKLLHGKCCISRHMFCWRIFPVLDVLFWLFLSLLSELLYNNTGSLLCHLESILLYYILYIQKCEKHESELLWCVFPFLVVMIHWRMTGFVTEKSHSQFVVWSQDLTARSMFHHMWYLSTHVWVCMLNDTCHLHKLPQNVTATFFLVLYWSHVKTLGTILAQTFAKCWVSCKIFHPISFTMFTAPAMIQTMS